MSDKIRRAEVTDAVKSMPAECVHCRDYGHQWKPLTVFREGRNFDQVLECVRCKTHRHRLIDRYGNLVFNRYNNYPAGYKVEGLGRLDGEDRGVLRLASVLDDLGPGR